MLLGRPEVSHFQIATDVSLRLSLGRVAHSERVAEHAFSLLFKHPVLVLLVQILVHRRFASPLPVFALSLPPVVRKGTLGPLLLPCLLIRKSLRSHSGVSFVAADPSGPSGRPDSRRVVAKRGV